MLKITKTDMNGSKVVLKLEGKITGQWAELLDAECRHELKNLKPIELDCAGVDFLDEKGVEVLKNLPRKQVTLLSAPGYVTELLHIGGRS
jgi:anti-anti-sigma regulatory factor